MNPNVDGFDVRHKQFHRTHTSVHVPMAIPSSLNIRGGKNSHKSNICTDTSASRHHWST